MLPRHANLDLGVVHMTHLRAASAQHRAALFCGSQTPQIRALSCPFRVNLQVSRQPYIGKAAGMPGDAVLQCQQLALTKAKTEEASAVCQGQV